MADIPRVEHTIKPNEAWVASASELLNATPSAQPATKEYTTHVSTGRVTIDFGASAVPPGDLAYRIRPDISAIAVADDGYVSIHKSSGTNGWTVNANGEYTGVTLQARDSGGNALTSTVILVTVCPKFQT